MKNGRTGILIRFPIKRVYEYMIPILPLKIKHYMVHRGGGGPPLPCTLSLLQVTEPFLNLRKHCLILGELILFLGDLRLGSLA